MWYLLKTEFKYFLFLQLAAIIFFLANIFFLLEIGFTNIPNKEAISSMFISLLGIVPFIVIGKIGILREREKRDRLLITLPVEIKKVAVVRTMVIVIPWILLFSLLVVLYLLFSKQLGELGLILLFTSFGTVIALMGTSVAFTTLRTSNPKDKKAKYFVLSLVSLAFLLPSQFILFEERIFIPIIIISCIGIGLVYTNIKKYIEGKNYLG